MRRNWRGKSKKLGRDIPVVVLAYDYREVKSFIARNPETEIDRIFLWQGNARILIAIVKYVEDKRNVRNDVKTLGVPVLLVVEDNIRYYSSILPVIYTELISQSRRVIREGINVAHKLVRQRARPKILLCSDYEDAARQAMEFRENLLAVVSDVQFPRGGAPERERGFELAHLIRESVPDVPIVLHSSHTEYRARAHAEGFAFLQKRSPTFLRDFRRLLTKQCAFGDFIFRMPDGTEVARASDMNALEAQLHTVPVESLVYHSQRNHFSRWLTARTEFAVAQKLRPRKVSDFPNMEALRQDLIHSINEYRREQSEFLIGDFNANTFKAGDVFSARWGGLAGREGARAGVCAAPALQAAIFERFPGVKVERADGAGVKHGCVRPLSGGEQPAGFCDSLQGRRGDSAKVSGGAFAGILAARSDRISQRSEIGRWRCGRQACWRIRNTSRSRACMKLSCWEIIRRI